MTEYIEREALLREFDELEPYEEYESEHALWLDMRMEVINAPAADVAEVVRCRDCKYHEDTHVIGFEHCCLYDLTMRYNDFCSYGKREGGSDND